ncbi:thiol-disulfide oxidoreductase DCC family protein [Streptomyces sp. NBC_01361]|uniref:thiol-disulfide oxidoreductase DCC family protein n=1 Tax=Streptomyces sp. NBC_01361 TaxID=2903838 RepID=UPI002E32AD8D|nr:DCC1-like thiol-disulfide oxidoreductase family protein [Streptomyces sp. NBC_01361]
MSGVADRGTTGAPVRRLVLLYDAQCPLCTFLRNWLARQRQLVPLDLVPAGSEEARRRCPGIDHISTLSEITLVGDSGQIYRGPAAWVVTLWALSEYRPLSHKFSTPAGARLARAAVLAAAKYRQAHRYQQVRKAGGSAYRRADGWVYDRVDGWTYYGPAACDSGCLVPD